MTSKNLIIYYSRTGENYVNGNIVNLTVGNTKICADYIKEIANGDLFQVDTVKAYSDNYLKCIEEAKEELNTNYRPILKKYLNDISNYDNIFILGPCWWGTYPMAVFSLLEKLNFTNKKIMPLMTHEGSGMGNSEKDLRKICVGATFGTSLAIHGADALKAKKAITDWVNKNI